MRFFAGARAAAGIAEEHVPAGGSLDQLTADLVSRHGERLGPVLAAATFLVDGLAWHDRATPLPETGIVDVLPPFAGG